MFTLKKTAKQLVNYALIPPLMFAVLPFFL